jgi:hypothetical protein
MVLTSPFMLLGLLALPVLAAIYWLRSRSRRVVVSNLAFWADSRRPRHGGRIFHRMQTPLTFFLELAAIALLVVAAAGPALLRKDAARPLVVVLDDSYSMLARRSGDRLESVRDRAEASLIEELRGNRYITRFVVAGAQPRLLGEPVYQPDRARNVLRQWTCQDGTADMAAAIALAGEVGGPAARVLVITDRPPTISLDGGQLEWRAFGSPLPNMALTVATRTPNGDGERVLLEVTNLSETPLTKTLTIEGGDLPAPEKSRVELVAGEKKQVFLNLPPAAPALSATLEDDALAVDNHVVLLPAAAGPLRVAVEMADSPLRQAVVRAVEAAGHAVQTPDRPDLVIADHPGGLVAEAWRLDVLGGANAAAYAGPFVIDQNHEIAEGLSLENVVWSASPEVELNGVPIVMAGNVVLMDDREDIAGRHYLQMNFVEGQSNLQDLPDWPILFSNLLQWRRQYLPGVADANVRLGQTVALTLANEASKVEIVAPDGDLQRREIRGRRIAITADRVGLHTIKTPNGEHQFSCNAVSPERSDLRLCRSGRWGNWNESPVHQDRRVGLSWVLVLVAMAVMAAHAAVVTGDAGGNR